MGTWWVRHRRLKERLAASDRSRKSGTSRAWSLLDGAGNVDDNVLEMPNGDLSSNLAFRTYEPWSERWSIWWLDGRTPGRLDPPVVGGFKDGIGTFIGPDTFDGAADPRPLLFWSDITATTCRWEQAFSVDDGATWRGFDNEIDQDRVRLGCPVMPMQGTRKPSRHR